MNHLRLDPVCDCNNGVENDEHFFFFKCYTYSDLRIWIFRAKREFQPLDIDKLLLGSVELTFDQNCIFFEAADSYIKYQTF